MLHGESHFAGHWYPHQSHVTGRMVVACHRKDGEYIAISQEADSTVNALLCSGRGWISCSLSAAGVGVRIRISVVVLEPGVAGGSIIPKSRRKDCGVCSCVGALIFPSHAFRACVAFGNICSSYSRTLGNTTEREPEAWCHSRAARWTWSQGQLQIEHFKENSCAVTHCGQSHSYAGEVTGLLPPLQEGSHDIFSFVFLSLSSFLPYALNPVAT